METKPNKKIILLSIENKALSIMLNAEVNSFLDKQIKTDFYQHGTMSRWTPPIEWSKPLAHISIWNELQFVIFFNKLKNEYIIQKIKYEEKSNQKIGYVY